VTVLRRLKEYLDREKVRYEVLAHQEAYTAPEIAHELHVSGKELAKVVMVKVDDRFGDDGAPVYVEAGSQATQGGLSNKPCPIGH